jgi:hypothetical protein
MAGDFLAKTLSAACDRAGWQAHAWVLMGNHLFIKTPEANLVEA